MATTSRNRKRQSCKSGIEVALVKKYQIKYLGVFVFHTLGLVMETFRLAGKAASLCEQYINTKMKHFTLVRNTSQCRADINKP